MTTSEHDQSIDKPKRGFMGNGITTQGFILVVIASSLMAIASLMLKQSLTASGGIGNGGGLFREIVALLSQPIFLIAVVIYGCGTLLWMRVLSDEPISIGFPILVSTSFIVVAIGSVLFFNEAMTWIKFVGIIVIVAGVLIASQG